MTRRTDVLVIGAGIAGLSVGSEFARDRSVIVLEREAGPAQHTTGRSAATFIEGYGGPSVAPFTRASRAWFESAGDGQVEHRLFAPRGLLVVAAPGDAAHFDHYARPGATRLSAADARALFPVLRESRCAAAAYDTSVLDIDAAGAVTAFRRALKQRGGELMTSSAVIGLRHARGVWHVEATADVIEAEVVVNAAGAWADAIAELGGLAPIGLRPLRRTICTFRAPDELDHTRWPMLVDAAERFYLKPETGQFLASPADETPSEPCDPRPEQFDVATALDRVASATILEPRSIISSWAGLRTFAPDRSLVLGPDPLAPSFAWCAGLGGFGIQVAPAAARAVVALVTRGRLPEDVAADGGNTASVLPDRLRT